jgi:capsular polysaccharide biosynthesis protein
MTKQSALPGDELRPLDPSLFSFHGFDDAKWVKGAQRSIVGAGISTGKLEPTVVDNAVFVPAVDRRRVRPSAGQPEMLAGGIVSRDGQPIAAAHLYRGGRRFIAGLAEPVATAPVAEVDEEVVHLGWLFDHHYGHFLLESLARTWVLPQVDPSTKVVFHHLAPARFNPPDWVLRILAAFGVPRERILVPKVATRFRRVIIPRPLFEMGHGAHELGAAPYQAVAAAITGGTPPSLQPLYLSRRLLPSAKRSIIGEAELEDVLRENGFLVAYPETMTFEDQVRLINSHREIITSTGSASHSVLFALHHPRLHLLTSGEFPFKTYFVCSALAGTPTAFVDCLEAGERSPEDTDRWQPEVMATAKLVEHLDELGLIKHRVRAALAGRNPSLREEYDEAWFYSRVAAVRRGVALPAAVEREAVDFARRSWPVSLALMGCYATRGEVTRVEEMGQQFTELAADEFDMNRLARYRAAVAQVAAIAVKRCEPETASRLTQMIADRFLVTLADGGP